MRLSAGNRGEIESHKSCDDCMNLGCGLVDLLELLFVGLQIY